MASGWQVNIDVISAKSLKIADKTASDPFVKIHVLNTNNKKAEKAPQTKVIKKNINPVWNENFVLPIESPASRLRLEVFDEDLVKNDKLGLVELKLLQFATGKEAVEMDHPVIYQKTGKQYGTLQLKISVNKDGKPTAPKNLEPGKWKAQDGDWEMKFFVNEEGNIHGSNKNDSSLKGGKKSYSGFVRGGKMEVLMTVVKKGQENRYWGTFTEDGFDIEVKVIKGPEAYWAFKGVPKRIGDYKEPKTDAEEEPAAE